MSESVTLKFTQVRIWLATGGQSLAVALGFQSPAPAEDVAARIRALRDEVLRTPRDAAPMNPDVHIVDHFGQDFTIDVRQVVALSVIDPIQLENLSSMAKVVQLKGAMHHEQRVKDDSRLSQWIQSHDPRQRSSLIHPGSMFQQ